MTASTINQTPVTIANESSWVDSAITRTARKAGYRKLAGTPDQFVEDSNASKFKHWSQQGRGFQNMARAHREGMQYTYAQMVRAQAEHQAENTDSSPTEIDDAVFTDTQVMSKIHRADMLRARPDLIKQPTHNDTTGQSKGSVRSHAAYGLSCLNRFFHGLCEFTSAPTGTAFKNMRNAVAPTGETTTKNKHFMPGLLLSIGMLYTKLFGAVKSEYTEDLVKKTALYGVGALASSSFVSSAAGLISFITGVASLRTMANKPLQGEQREAVKHEKSQISAQLETFLRHIQKKNNASIDRLLSRALRSVLSPKQEKGSIPPLMQKLKALDLDENKAQNVAKIEHTIGEYLSCQDTELTGRAMKTEIGRRERELVKILNLFDHPEVKPAQFTGGSIDDQQAIQKRPNSKKDIKTNAESLGETLHDKVFQGLSSMVKYLNSGKENCVSKRLAKWGSPAHRARQAAKLKDPLNAARYHKRGDYMIANLHQYGPVTRALVNMSESLRFFAFNYLLATNVQSSRVFGAIARKTQTAISQQPASRSLCHSLGRFFGGAVVTAIFSVVVGGFIADTPAPTSLQMGEEKVGISQAGFMMAVFTAISLPLMWGAHLAMRMEGWKGNVSEQASKNKPAMSL